MSVHQGKAKSIFLNAAEMPSGSERQAYVAEECGADDELRREVEALLEHHAGMGSFLEAGAMAAPAATLAEPVREEPGTMIGPYKLLEQIGEGGFGVVFMAEQTEPVRRKVALKVLKPGMDSRQVVARFEAERQALALMDHPNIAHVFDGGATPSGRPYFVMELVKGLPITAFCDEHVLSIRERLDLFLAVCQAVQHAHQKGVIHRDLKPSNILVTLHDVAPVVKVIDFGIAKATGLQLTEKTLVTGFAQMIGTPLYMSPEQAGLSGLDVDTRSDIYSLGVLLYELLTGATPFDPERLREVGCDEMRRIIREEEPPRPSARFSTLGQAASTVSQQRKSEPRKLSAQLRRELDWVVMKCLEKDRNRRYETCNALAMDLQRYLRDEPVQACPPSAGYRLRKFVRRNRGAVVAAAVVLLAVFLGGASWSWFTLQEAARVSAAENLATEDLKEGERLIRKGQFAEAKAVVTRAQGLLENGGGAELQQRMRLLLADLEMVVRLDEARLEQSEIKNDFFDYARAEPVYAEAFRLYGLAVDSLPAQEAAERIQARSITVGLASALDDWASVRRKMPKDTAKDWEHLVAVARLADPDERRNLLRDALERRDHKALVKLAASEETLSWPAPTLLLLGQTLAETGASEEAAGLLRKAAQRHPGDFWINHKLAYVLVHELKPSQPGEALRFYTAAVAIRSQNPAALSNLGIALAREKRTDEAIAAFRQAIHFKPDSALNHFNLAVSLEDNGERNEAIAAYRRAILHKPDFAWAYQNLGIALAQTGQLDDALTAFREAVRHKPDFAQAHDQLGISLLDKRQPDAAIVAFRQAIYHKPNYAQAHYNLGTALLGKRDRNAAIDAFRQAIHHKPDYALAYGNLGAALLGSGETDAAIVALRQAIHHAPDFAEAHCNLGVALKREGQRREAIAAFRRAIHLKADYADAHYNLGLELAHDRKLDEAIAAYRQAIRHKADFGAAHNQLGVALLDTGNPDEAAASFREAIRLEPDHPLSHYNLGIALMEGKGQPEEAIAHFREAIRLKSDYAQAHCNLGHALQRTGQVAAALAALRRGHELRPKDAKKWPYASARWIQECERLITLDQRLPAVLRGDDAAADAAECLEFGRLCTYKQLHGAALRFLTQAFAAAPGAESNLWAGHRDRAARAAAQAGTGRGKDADKLDEPARADCRRQALDWLRADLALLAKQLKADRLQNRTAARRVLQNWQCTAELACVRDPVALSKLPDVERERWREFWTDVANTLAVARET